jgi:hypothetical protein
LSPIESLRFYCSLAMKGQDWLDVEPFFDAVIAEQNKQPDLAEHLRQFKHNDGSGLVFGYDKDGIDKLFASLNKQPPAESGEGVVYQRRRVKDLLTHGTWEEVLPITYEQNYEGYEHRILYTSQTTATQAAVAAAMRKAAEVCNLHADIANLDGYTRTADRLRQASLAITSLIPADDMQALRELMMEVAISANEWPLDTNGDFVGHSTDDLTAIVDRILAEKGEV